jgi:prevent-host-death family protein
MAKRMSTGQVRANLSDILGAVSTNEEPVIVERNGKPIAVVISARQYEALERAKERAWQVLDELQAQNADVDPDSFLEEATEAVEAVRQERYAAQQQAAGRG